MTLDRILGALTLLGMITGWAMTYQSQMDDAKALREHVCTLARIIVSEHAEYTPAIDWSQCK